MASFWRKYFGLGSTATHRQKGLQVENPALSGKTAVPVTVDSALQLSAVWACVKLISECLGSMPLNIYDVDEKTGERKINKTHPLAILFNGKVNRWQTRNEFFECLGLQLVLLGNGYVMVERNSSGNIIALTPLMSEQMETALGDNGDIVYKYTDGSTVKAFSSKSIWHNKLFGNGIVGLSPLGYARQSVGIGQAAEQSVNKIYTNGGKPSGVLMIDKLLTPEQRASIKSTFSELAEGNNDRLFVLEAGMKYEQVSLSPQDIELLASRRFQIEDIARFFGVPSVLINDTASNTTWGSGIQQIVQGFYKLGLRPYLERIESSMKVWLLTPEERQKMDIEFDFDSLLRPDLFERIKVYKEAVQGGIVTPNQARRYEGWPALTGGDELYMQRQMIPIKDLPKIIEPVSKPETLQK
jgi:HK97 family phage portal protein